MFAIHSLFNINDRENFTWQGSLANSLGRISVSRATQDKPEPPKESFSLIEDRATTSALLATRQQLESIYRDIISTQEGEIDDALIASYQTRLSAADTSLIAIPNYSDNGYLQSASTDLTSLSSSLDSIKDPIAPSEYDSDALNLLLDTMESNLAQAEADFDALASTASGVQGSGIGDQASGSIGTFSDGSYISVWSSDTSDGNGEQIIAQRYDANGTAVGSSFTVNDAAAGNQTDPSVTYLSGGDFVITFTDESGLDGDGRGVYGQRYDSDGNATGSNFLINTTTAKNQYGANVTASSDGGFVVAYTSVDSPGAGSTREDVYFQRFDSDGNKVGSETRVNTYTDKKQDNIQITVLSNGNLVTVFRDFDGNNGSSRGVFGQLWDSEGNKIGSEFEINDQSPNGIKNVTVTNLNDGGFIAVFEGKDSDGRGLFAKRYDADGNALTGEFQVNTGSALDQLNPSVATLSDGGYVVAYEKVDSDSEAVDIAYQRFDSDDNAVGDELVIASGIKDEVSDPTIQVVNETVIVSYTRVEDPTDPDSNEDQIVRTFNLGETPSESELNLTASELIDSIQTQFSSLASLLATRLSGGDNQELAQEVKVRLSNLTDDLQRLGTYSDIDQFDLIDIDTAVSAEEDALAATYVLTREEIFSSDDKQVKLQTYATELGRIIDHLTQATRTITFSGIANSAYQAPDSFALDSDADSRIQRTLAKEFFLQLQQQAVLPLRANHRVSIFASHQSNSSSKITTVIDESQFIAMPVVFGD